MKKLLIVIFGICSVFLPTFTFASTLYDYYNDAPNDYNFFCNTREAAQSFTATTSYTVSSIKVWLGKAGSPGEFQASIQGVDGSGFPDGTPFCNGTTSEASITASQGSEELYEIIMSSGCDLTQGTQYSIVVDSAGGTWISNTYSFAWHDPSSYAGGVYMYYNSGWFQNTARDYTFEVWGDEPPPPPPPASGQLTFPMVLIVILATFLLCFMIDKGGQKVIDAVNNLYKYRIK